MNTLKDRYAEALRIPEKSSEKDSPKKAALQRAFELRSFEIELYWKRATYFWGFQIAIFAAFGLFAKEAIETNPLVIALGVLGILTAIANLLSAAGSKFWQQNWESHIDMLEDDFEGRLHKTVWLEKGQVSYSVTRINERLSSYFVFFWVFISCYALYSYVWHAHSTGAPFWRYAYAAAVVGVAVWGTTFLYGETSKLDEKYTDHEGVPERQLVRRSVWDRRVYASDDRNFIERQRPDDSS